MPTGNSGPANSCRPSSPLSRLAGAGQDILRWGEYDFPIINDNLDTAFAELRAILMTEPLSEEQWSRIGWNGYELLGDATHGYCYAQRTREGRIAMGGRGVPYRYGSATDVRGQTQDQTIAQLYAILMRHLPQTKGLKMEHAWCGVLGVPRDWCTTVGLDRKNGIGWAGGRPMWCSSATRPTARSGGGWWTARSGCASTAATCRRMHRSTPSAGCPRTRTSTG